MNTTVSGNGIITLVNGDICYYTIFPKVIILS